GKVCSEGGATELSITVSPRVERPVPGSPLLSLPEVLVSVGRNGGICRVLLALSLLSTYRGKELRCWVRDPLPPQGRHRTVTLRLHLVEISAVMLCFPGTALRVVRRSPSF
ncbi:unnamed protein product, partial [Scytosiphon promiscuus]